jgi:hypothetical protein
MTDVPKVNIFSKIRVMSGDGVSKHLYNVGHFLSGYTLQHPRRVILILSAVRT